MPRKDDYHGYLRHLSRDAAESSSGTGVHASSQANHLNSRYGRRRGMPRRGTSTAPSRTLADLACLLCCLGICTSGVWFLGSAAYHFFATPLESEPGPPQVSLLPSPPQQSGAGAFQLLPSSDAERARAASLEVLKSAFAARGLPVPSDGALASSASDSSSSLAYPPLPHSYHELLPQFGGAAQEAEEEEAPPEPTPQPTGATVCIPPTQGYNLQGLGRRRRKAGKGGGSPAAAAAAALIDARISGATGASNASSSDSKWAPVGEQPQHVGSSEILEDARAAGSKQNGIVGFDAEPPPLYTRLRLAGLRNSGRRTVEEMVSRLLFVYCAAEGGDKPRICEQVGKTRSSPASGSLATGPGVTVRIWREKCVVRGWSFTAFRPETFATAMAPLTKKDKGNRVGFTADWPRAPSNVPSDYHGAGCMRIPKPKGRHSFPPLGDQTIGQTISGGSGSSSSNSSGSSVEGGREEAFDDDDLPLQDDATKRKAQAFEAAAQAENAVKAARATRAAAEASANVLAPLDNREEGDAGGKGGGGLGMLQDVEEKVEEENQGMIHGMRRLLISTVSSSTGNTAALSSIPSNGYQVGQGLGGTIVVGHGSPHVAWSDGSSEAHQQQTTIDYRTNHERQEEPAKTLEELEAESRRAQQEAEEREEAWRWAQEAKKAKEAADARGKMIRRFATSLGGRAVARAAAARVCVPDTWTQPATEEDFKHDSLLKKRLWVEFPEEIGRLERQAMHVGFYPGQWRIKHLVVLRNPSRVALSKLLSDQASSVPTWTSDVLIKAVSMTAATSRWTALRVLWHQAMLPDDTLTWHYEDLEIAPIVLMRSLCKFLALEYRLIDKNLEKAWTRASEASPLRFKDAKEYATARGHNEKSPSSTDNSAEVAGTVDIEFAEKTVEEMVQEELEKIKARESKAAEEEAKETNKEKDKEEEVDEEEGWPPLPLPDSNQALLGATSDEDLKPGSVWFEWVVHPELPPRDILEQDSGIERHHETDNGFSQRRRQLQRLSQEEAELDFKDDVSSSGIDGASSREDRAEAAAKVLRIANMFKAAEEQARADEKAARQERDQISDISSSSSFAGEGDESGKQSSSSSSSSSSSEDTSKDSNQGDKATAEPTTAWDVYDYLEAVQGVLWGCEGFDGEHHESSLHLDNRKNGSGYNTFGRAEGEEMNKHEQKRRHEEEDRDEDAFFLSPSLKQSSLPDGLRAASEHELAHAAKTELWTKKTRSASRGSASETSSSSGKSERWKQHRVWSRLDELCCRYVDRPRFSLTALLDVMKGGTGEDNISSEDSEDHSGVSQALRQYHLAGGGMLCGLGDSISSDSDRSSSSKNNGDSRSSSSSSQSSSSNSNTKNNGNSSPYSPPPSQRQHHRSRTVDHTKASVVRLAHEWVLYERSGSGLRLKYQGGIDRDAEELAAKEAMRKRKEEAENASQEKLIAQTRARAKIKAEQRGQYGGAITPRARSADGGEERGQIKNHHLFGNGPVRIKYNKMNKDKNKNKNKNKEPAAADTLDAFADASIESNEHGNKEALRFKTETKEKSNDNSRWETAIDPASGRKYYFNRQSGVSRWDLPEGGQLM